MYIDSANLEEIQELISFGVFKGVTTNPTLLLKEKVERIAQLNNILDLGIQELFVQLEGRSLSELYDDFLLLQMQLNEPEKIAYKIPINQAGILTIKKILKDYPEATLLGTAIYSAEQMYVAILAGCTFVAPYINRMQVQGIDAYEMISSANRFILKQKKPCQIMGASFKNSQQVRLIYDAGADTVTLPKDIVLQMINREGANQAIAIFNQDGQQLREIST